MTMTRSVHTTTRTLIAALAATALLAACGSDSKSASTTADPATTGPAVTTPSAPAITVSDAWARTSATVATAGAVYMTIANAGGIDDALIAASVDPSVAKTVELHETIALGSDDSAGMTPATGMATETTAGAGMATDTTAGNGGMMQMQPVDRIVTPASGSVALAPGGYHIMLVDLVTPLVVGSSVELTLTFETSGDQIVTAAVRDTAP